MVRTATARAAVRLAAFGLLVPAAALALAPAAQAAVSTPSLSAAPTANSALSVPTGTVIIDKATLAGGSNPTGTITFKLYGPFITAPGSTSCTATTLVSTFNSTVPVTGIGTFSSASFTPTTAGVYQFVATYSGDTRNNSVSGVCGDTTEQVTVADKATPTLTTDPTTAPDNGGGNNGGGNNGGGNNGGGGG